MRDQTVTRTSHYAARAAQTLKEPAAQRGCRWGDLNPQGHTATRPSTVRVYQFRHTDVCELRVKYSGVDGLLMAAGLDPLTALLSWSSHSADGRSYAGGVGG
jgi:hypothetical protein